MAKLVAQIATCPRCYRRYAVNALPSSSALREALLAVGWRLDSLGSELACPHCWSRPVCVERHDLEVKRVVWYRPESGEATLVCSACGLVRSISKFGQPA